VKKIYFAVVSFLVIVIVLVSSFIYWFKKEMGPVAYTSEKVSFIVPEGKSASQVGELLFKENLIKNPLVFKLYVRLVNKTKNINSGEFELSRSMSVSEIVNALGKGPRELWVTIPEGLRKEEIVEKIIKALGMDKENSDKFRNEFLSLSNESEGYLFPDTYLFPADVSPQLVFAKLTLTFDEKYTQGLEGFMKNAKFTKNEIVIMASILERETKGMEEKPVVAGILWKRIENDWPLQIDATVQYAIANSQPTTNNLQQKDWWLILSLSDLNIDSTYNTYKYKGLPPAPICNPGLASLQAAANPQSSEYWFYIHSDDGQIHYAKTSEEHAANVRKYLGKY